jgi:hypothetical protein
VVRAKPDTPSALLLRPDSYVAWATDNPIPTKEDREKLKAAATRWFGNNNKTETRQDKVTTTKR